MIRLNRPKGPYWLDLTGGVRIRVKPLTTALNSAAMAHARTQVVKVLAEIASRKEVGVTFDDLPNLDDDAVRSGYSEALYIKCLTKEAALEWEGVLNPDNDDLAPITQETVSDLMDVPGIAQDFIAKYTKDLNGMQVELGKSAPSPDGSTGEAQTTAEDADKSTPPAPKAKKPQTAATARA